MPRKQAKILTPGQQIIVLNHLSGLPYFARNRVIFLLSMKAGVRAKEICGLRWRSVTDAQGSISHQVIIEDAVSKGGYSGRRIPMNADLRIALIALHSVMNPDKNAHVVVSHRTRTGFLPQTLVNKFYLWYRDIGFEGASSHSGRRTFITNAARNINLVGGSLRDVQHLAGHRHLRTTELYIEGNDEAKRRIVDIV